MRHKKTHTTIRAVFVITLGLSLHFGYRALSSEMPSLFPHLVQEAPKEVPLPIVEAAITPSIEPNVTLPLPPPLPKEAALAAKSAVKNKPLPPPSRTLGLEGRAERVSYRFSTPPALAPIVDFWKDVYATYTTNQTVLHDNEFLQIRYSVLDFTELNRRSLSDKVKKKFKEDAVEREANRIRAILEELDQAPDIKSLSPEAQRIALLFKDIRGGDKFKAASERVRSQMGLKDRFHEALQRSGRYLPHFENIFQAYGVPKEITRLAFVESLFREGSYSKVGAAGLWQFMASSARHYMVVNNQLDERYDPLVATQGAARLLLRNYQLLGTWPLAINAYNSGAGNLMKAVKRLGTRDIDKIILNFRSGSYAFASRNFYPSFLAALSIYENAETYFGAVPRETPMAFDLVELPSSMTFPQIAWLADTNLKELHTLNPGFLDNVFEGAYALPAKAQVRLPRERQALFASRLIDFYSAGNVQFHVVRSGETIDRIARRYELSSLDLEKANPSAIPTPGSILRVPHATELVRIP